MFIADSVVLVLLAASGNSHLVERNAWPAALIFYVGFIAAPPQGRSLWLAP